MRLILAGLGVSQILGYGVLYYAFPLFVPHVAASFGTTPPVLFGIFSAGLLLGGLVAPRAGALMDRHGAPRLMTLGSLAAALGLLVAGLAPTLWIWGAAILWLELVGVIVLYDAAFATLAQLTGPAARRAITRLTLIAGFASTLFWPLTDALIGALGWRGTLLCYAALHLTVGTGIHLWLARLSPTGLPAPRRPAAPPVVFAPVPPALERSAMRAVGLSFAVSGMLIAAIGMQMVAVLDAAGLGTLAVGFAMLMGPAQVGARIIDAVFWGNWHPLSVAILSTLALPVSLAGLLLGAPPLLAAGGFAILFGAGQGLASIVRGSVPLALFGPAGYGARLGRLARLRTLLSAFAPVAFATLMAGPGLVPALWISAVLGVAAAVPLIRLRLALGPLRPGTA